MLDDRRTNNFLNEFRWHLKLEAEIPWVSCKSFFGLAVESWIDNLCIEKNPQTLFDLFFVDFKIFVFFANSLNNFITNLGGNHFNMCATPSRTNRIYERHLRELLLTYASLGSGDTEIILVSVVVAFELIRVEVMITVLFKVVNFNLSTIQVNFY